MRGSRPEDPRRDAPEPGALPTIQARVCPYSRDTVAGCPLYQPVSAHGSAPDAAMCRYVVTAQLGKHVRTLVCVRESAERER